jgi:spore coat protein A, manganese oxidase
VTHDRGRPSSAQFLVVLAMLLIVAILTPIGAATAQAPPAKGPTPKLTRFTEELPIPPVVDLTGGGSYTLRQQPGMHRFHDQLGDTPTYGYNATYLGPTLEVMRGTPVTVDVENDLDDPSRGHPVAEAVDPTLFGVTEADRTAPRTATHQHGGHLPDDSDGGPLAVFVPPSRAVTSVCATDPIETVHLDEASPSSCYRYEYPNDQEATTLWYHDHAVGITRLNVIAGLAGFYLVRDRYDTGRAGNALGLPSGDHEIPLAIQDRSFTRTADGSALSYPLSPPLDSPYIAADRVWIPEFFGDTPIVNGKAYPNLTVDRGLYRFRVLNGSNARVYRLRLAVSTGGTLPFFQIGTDGGLLDAPAPLTHLTIAPGERADLLVDFGGLAPGTRVVAKNNAGTPFPNGPRAAHVGGPSIADVMQFTVGNAVAAPALTVPSTLRGGPALDQPAPLPRLAAPTEPSRVRNIMLNEILDPVTGTPVEALINNLEFHDHDDGGARSDRIERPTAGTVEQWNLINTTGDTHPIHLHLVQFQVLDRQKLDAGKYLAAVNAQLMAENPGLAFGLPHPDAAGLGPWPSVAADGFLRGQARSAPANEAGWKDTVQAQPGEVTRILVQFGSGDDVSAYTDEIAGDYVFHCHILEHEDNDMMLPYEVLPSG